MANVCEICAKGERAGMNVSHSHLKTKRTWKTKHSACTCCS